MTTQMTEPSDRLITRQDADCNAERLDLGDPDPIRWLDHLIDGSPEKMQIVMRKGRIWKTQIHSLCDKIPHANGRRNVIVFDFLLLPADTFCHRGKKNRHFHTFFYARIIMLFCFLSPSPDAFYQRGKKTSHYYFFSAFWYLCCFAFSLRRQTRCTSAETNLTRCHIFSLFHAFFCAAPKAAKHE